MPKLKSVRITIIVLMIFFNACVMDYESDIAIIKNNTSNRLIIAKQPSDIMTDSILFNGLFSKCWVEANQVQFITLHNIRLGSQPDSAKAFLYVFNDDSVYRYQTLKKKKGIVQHSFIKKIEIQLNKVKDPLDTIFISRKIH